MLQTRYEEYASIPQNLPCVFNKGIKKTSINYSKNANWHDNLEIELCTNGQGYILLDGENHGFCKNDIAVVNSNVIHYTGSETLLYYDCLIIDTKFCQRADINPQKLCFKPLITDQHIKEQFLKIRRIYENPQDLCFSAKVQSAILEILITLRKKYTLSETPTKISGRHFETVKETLRYIKENYNEKITLDSLAKKVYSDKFSLSKKFKAVTGSTIIEYINAYRCEKAIELIREGNPINEAALKCGFNNMSFFTRTFKAHTGRLPSEYKK
ncbi:MAG: helix-turn-helix transcriptional regulator [Clostridia bacterium]|nr:helix-turn-helix transcriptional regulator [Clostridia bacterium]